MDLAQKEKYEEEKKNNYQQILQEFQSKENSETILKSIFFFF